MAAVITWGVCLLLGEILGPSAGRPVTDSLAGLNTSYPVTQFAVAMAATANAAGSGRVSAISCSQLRISAFPAAGRLITRPGGPGPRRSLTLRRVPGG